ncbi:MAG: TolC family protein [Bacteroidales bacterium]|nr:TolC family protein [Bacteroidales bacterium]
MKSKNIISYIILFGFISFATTVTAQQKPKEWDLRSCINYALENNIQIKMQQQSVEIGKVNFEQSKAEKLPNLNGGIGQSFTNQMASTGSSQEQSVTGNYSLKSEMVLYNGNKLNNTISQKELLVKSGELTVKQAENNMELTITAAYLKILYAKESVVNAENTLISSETQNKRAKILFESGYIAESNYAQVQSQYSKDKYALVLANNTLNLLKLQLKQLLQLGINDTLVVKFPVLDDNQGLKALPVKQDVFNTALNTMPEVENSKVNMAVAAIDLDIAKAGLLPSLSLSASLATGHSTLATDNYATQLGNNFYQNAGLSLNIPIFNKKQVKSSISKAQIGIETAKLSYAEIQTSLLTEVETAYLDVVSAQSRFQAASEQLKFTLVSYSLVEEQFNLGMKNTVELLTEKTNYLTAQQEYLQAKYTAILNYKILDFYQNKPIEL